MYTSKFRFYGGVFLFLGFIGGVLFVGCQSAPAPRGEWTTDGRVRSAPLAQARGDAAGFERLDSTRTGIGFANTVTEDMIARNRNMLHGSGVAVGDVDGDDWPDLFVTQLGGPNRLYLNQGQFEFEDVPGAGGAALESGPWRCDGRMDAKRKPRFQGVPNRSSLSGRFLSEWGDGGTLLGVRMALRVPSRPP